MMANGPTSMCHVADIICVGNPAGLSARRMVFEYRTFLFKNRQHIGGRWSRLFGRCACLCRVCTACARNIILLEEAIYWSGVQKMVMLVLFYWIGERVWMRKGCHRIANEYWRITWLSNAVIQWNRYVAGTTTFSAWQLQSCSMGMIHVTVDG